MNEPTLYKFIEPFVIRLDDKLGKGSLGEVFRGTDLKNNSMVAVKMISKD